MIARLLSCLRERRQQRARRASWCIPATDRQRVASEQRWARQQHLAAIDAQIDQAAADFRRTSTSGDES